MSRNTRSWGLKLIYEISVGLHGFAVTTVGEFAGSTDQVDGG